MLLNELQAAVIEEFLGNYMGSFTGSDIAKKKSLNQKSVSNILNSLEDEGFLRSKTAGKNKEFSINMDNIEIVRNLITAAEHLRTANFLKKHPIIKEIIFKTKPHFNGITIVFGSYSKGIQKKDSDLDIFIAGTYSRNSIHRISELYNLQISVKNYPPDAFRRALKNKDILLTEVIKNHVIISGAEEFVNAVMSDYYGKN